MILDHQKYRLLDKNNKHNLMVEVNWDVKDPKTNECKVVKFIHPDGSESFVDRKELHGFLFMIGRQLDQAQLIPQRQKVVREYETIVGVKAKEDIRKGEEIRFPIKINIPIGEQEYIAPLTKSNKLITPKS